MFNQEFLPVSCKNHAKFFWFRFIQFSLIVYLLIHFFIDWLIDRFLYLSFLYTSQFINHQTQTERLLKNVRKITLESWLKLTYNPHMHFKSIDPTVSSSVPFRDVQLVGALPLHLLAEIQAGASLVMRKREEGGIITWPRFLHMWYIVIVRVGVQV